MAKCLLLPGKLLYLSLDLWNFQAPTYWMGKFLSFTQRQNNRTPFSHYYELTLILLYKKSFFLNLCHLKWKEQGKLKLSECKVYEEPINLNLWHHNWEMAFSGAPVSLEEALSTPISTKKSVSIKHLIFDSCTKLNLPEPETSLLKHKSQWNQSVILLMAPCHNNNIGEYCFWLVSPLTYQDKDSSSILALVQQLIGDRSMHGNVYFL